MISFSALACLALWRGLASGVTTEPVHNRRLAAVVMTRTSSHASALTRVPAPTRAPRCPLAMAAVAAPRRSDDVHLSLARVAASGHATGGVMVHGRTSAAQCPSLTQRR